VQKKWKQMRRMLTAYLAMMLLVTVLLPNMPAQAAWSTVNHTVTSFLKNAASEQNTFGTASDPIDVSNRKISGLTLTNSSTMSGPVTVKVNGVVVSTTTISSTSSFGVPAFVLDNVETIQTVTITFGSEVATLFYQYKSSNSDGTFTVTPAIPIGSTGNGNNSSDPIVTKTRTITGLKARYTDSSYGNTTGAHPIEVYVGNDQVQTINTTSGTEFTVSPFDLKLGLNAIRIESPNTGKKMFLYYEYQSADSPIVLTDYSNVGTSINNPLLHSESKITLNGVYGIGVSNPNNLRLKITTNNGLNVTDLSGTAPVVDENKKTFSFVDIALQPGLNVISFYERVGAITREHSQFYVQFNNTPFLDALKINDTTLGTSETLIKVSSMNRLSLNMDGIAKNAESVIVENTTTGDRVNAVVTRTGTFSLNLPSKLGKNELKITAYNDNKTVGAVTRSIFVVTTDRTDSHQFYNVSIKNTTLLPGEVGSLKAPGSTNSTSVDVSGTALLMFERNSTQQFKEFKMTVKEKSTGDTWTYTGIAPTTTLAKGNGFTEYGVKVTIDPSQKPNSYPTGRDYLRFVDSDTYTISLSYQYQVWDPGTSSWIDQGYTPVKNYEYQFSYVDSDKPYFGDVKYNSLVLRKSSANPIDKSSIDLTIMTHNMSDGVFSATYEGNPIGTFSSVTGGQKLSLNNLQAGTGELAITYSKDSTVVTVKYKLYVQTTPYIQLTYVDATGQLRIFDDGYQITGENDYPNLSAKVYNYDLKKDDSSSSNVNESNVRITLNGYAIVENNDSNVDNDQTINGLTINSGTNGTFTISSASIKQLIAKKGKGTHVLKIELTTAPAVVFDYDILYVSSKAPSIEDVKLKIVENGKENDLSKKPTDAAYQTSAYFLSELGFTVNDAVHVYIEKNGKRIADYRYKDGDWDMDETNQEYVKALNELPDNMDDEFDDYNFKPQSKTKFRADMSSSDYGDLIENIQDEVTKLEEQEAKLALFPLNLKKNGSTVYTIVAEDDNGSILRYDIRINQQTGSWEVISPVKAKESDQYIIVNSNSVPIKIFAENASKVLFGKTEATVTNTTQRDFYYNDDIGKTVPKSYYVFTATVPLKKGLNTIKYTVQTGNSSFNDEIKIFNANSSVNGAEYRDVLGKKVSFSVFDKALELKFPAGTVLLSPPSTKAGEEIQNPSGDIFVDVPLYFGIADRTTGQVSIEGDSMESKLNLERNFNYGSPLYYIDAGDIEAPGGRDPYEEDNDADIEEFKDRYEDNLVPSKRGTLSIKYDASIVNAANNVLTVFYNSGDGWENIGGVVNTSKKVITVPFEGFGYYMVMKTRETFDDVIHHDYARDAMETLYSKGIMPNYSSNSFGANRDMTRGEFATMLVKALDLPINAGPYSDSSQRDPLEPTFSDVRPRLDTWDYQYIYIETAARAGIVRGTDPGYFRPSDSLTRQEAAIMIARAMNMKMTGSVEAAKANLGKQFTDGKDVGYYAATSVLAVTKAKIMNGEPNDASAKKPTYRFLPNSNLTRAEMAVITIRIMTQLKKLPK